MALILTGSIAGSAVSKDQFFWLSTLEDPAKDAITGTGDTVGRSVEVHVQVSDRVVATLDLRVPNDDPILSDASLRRMQDDPNAILFATGIFGEKHEEGIAHTYALSGMTLLRNVKADTSVLSIRLVSAPLDVGDAPYSLAYLPPFRADAHVSLEVEDPWLLTSAVPGELIESQTGSAAETTPIAVDLDRTTIEFVVSSPAALQSAYDRGSIAGNWLDSTSIATALWMTATWTSFYFWLLISRRRRPSIASATPYAWTRLGPLIAAFIALSFAPYLDRFDLWLRQLVPWQPSGSAADGFEDFIAAASLGNSSGVIVGFVVAWGWSLLLTREPRRPRALWWALSLAVVTIAVAGVLISVLFAMPTRSPIVEGPLSPQSIPLVTSGVVALAVGGCLVIRALGGAYAWLGGVSAAALGASFIALSPVFDVEWVNVAAHLLVVGLIVFATCALVDWVSRCIGNQEHSHRRWLVLGTATIVVASTAPRVFRTNESSVLSEAEALRQLFAGPVLIALTVVLVVGLARSGPQLGEWTRRGLFLTGVVCFFRFTTFVGLPISLFVGGTLLALVLLAHDAGTKWRTPADNAIAQGVRTFVSEVGQHRMERDYADALRKTIAAGDVDQKDLAATKNEVTRVHYQSNAVAAGAMAWGGTPSSALLRGAFGAAVATAVGLPFAVDSIRDILGFADDATGPFVLVDMLDAVIGLRFPIYGFAFGFLFPALRGYRGIGKALVTASILIITESIFLLVPFEWDLGRQEVLLLRILQLLTVFLALGLAFDLRSLRSAGLGLDRVGDIYNVNRFVVWGAGLLVAAAAAFATSLLDSAADALLKLITGGSS